MATHTVVVTQVSDAKNGNGVVRTDEDGPP